MTNPADPSDKGSIRDRLQSPVPSSEANSGGDSRHSDLTDAGFQQTDSRGALHARGHDEGQQGVPHATPVTHAHAPLDPALEEAKARAAERKIAGLFLASFASVIAFFFVYFLAPFKFTEPNNIYFTPTLAVLMGIALGGIGAGTVMWAKNLMGHEETVQERHPFGSPPEERAAAAELLVAGAQESQLGRRSLLRNTLLLSGGALALLPLPLLFDLGPYAHKERGLATTAWKKGMRLVRENGTPVRIGDLGLGSIDIVFPDVPGGNMMADAPTMLIRMQPGEFKPVKGREDWSVDGHVAYSVICTHLGCPVKLYEQQTHHLFCPCHQSTFDASNGAKVLFGPAARPLPQLAISVDADGYFIAQGDYHEPVGPSYWERKP
ncbi:MAG: Rieske (2Fe-2S) iron-sulfur domain protein [Frankiales bacterium]|jgi:ubiquinol-cytochrome c reductase iron-sulfur subunit|nr:Rieske (2Fe-2S) iron-sulfur domain protein [Frankiales bacterium]